MKQIYIVFSLLFLLINVGCLINDSISQLGEFDESDKLVNSSILIVQSYHEGLIWSNESTQGIIESFQNEPLYSDNYLKKDIFYMDTKQNFITPDEIEKRAELAIKMIDKNSYDIVFVGDDNALKYVAQEYLISNPSTKTKFIYSGINAPKETYEVLNNPEYSDKIIGIFEENDIHFLLESINVIFPDFSRPLVIIDKTFSATQGYIFVKDYFESKKSEVFVTDYKVEQVSYFSEIKNILETYDGKYDYIVILSLFQIFDDENNILDDYYTIPWLVDRVSVPVFGMHKFYSDYGVTMSMGISSIKTGNYVGDLGVNYLKYGKFSHELEDVPLLISLALSSKQFDRFNVSIPPELLPYIDTIYD